MLFCNTNLANVNISILIFLNTTSGAPIRLNTVYLNFVGETVTANDDN